MTKTLQISIFILKKICKKILHKFEFQNYPFHQICRKKMIITCWWLIRQLSFLTIKAGSCNFRSKILIQCIWWIQIQFHGVSHSNLGKHPEKSIPSGVCWLYCIVYTVFCTLSTLYTIFCKLYYALYSVVYFRYVHI